MSDSGGTYEPSQFLEGEIDLPELRSASAKQPRRDRAIARLFEAGGALDSQTTDSQYIDHLMAARDPSETLDKAKEPSGAACDTCIKLRARIESLEEEAISLREDTHYLQNEQKLSLKAEKEADKMLETYRALLDRETQRRKMLEMQVDALRRPGPTTSSQPELTNDGLRGEEGPPMQCSSSADILDGGPSQPVGLPFVDDSSNIEATGDEDVVKEKENAVPETPDLANYSFQFATAYSNHGSESEDDGHQSGAWTEVWEKEALAASLATEDYPEYHAARENMEDIGARVSIEAFRNRSPSPPMKKHRYDE
ncbi:hypothetical protein OF83DRAFT_1288428 [Amylostereum chailletii]|nr:hypothetical protein OF83DRAFT_1288428 [Amylostereum chailletii]